MATPRRFAAWFALGTLGFAAAMGSAAADDPMTSLPPGPKNLLSSVSEEPAALLDLAGATRSSAEWIAHLEAMQTAMTPEQIAMLADYLALAAPAAVEGDDTAAILAALPADGRELFAANCFACHGVAKYYLLQDRDADGWMDIFAAPYHRRLLTADNERELFSSYSANAMPIAEDAIPAEWRE